MNWEICELDTLGKIVTGTTPNTKKPEYYGDGYPFIAPGDIGESVYVRETQKSLSEEGIKVSRSLPKDAILVVCIGATIGKTAMTFIDKSATNQQINAIIPNQKVFPQFLYYSLKYRADDLPPLAGRAAVPIINKSNFSKFSVLLPPLPEQRAIARALSVVQAAREARLRELALERERKTALMEHLFTHGSVPFNDPQNLQLDQSKSLPKGWKWVSLDSVCQKIQDGSHFSPQILYDLPGKGRYLYITSKNIKEMGLDLSDISYVDSDFHKEIFRRCDPRKGDVLLIKDGVMTGIATVNDLDDEFSLLSSVVQIRVNNDYLDPYYLKHFLNSPIGFKIVTGGMTGSAIKRIILGKVKTASILLPPKAIQDQIAEILNAYDSKIIALDHEARLLDGLFRAMLEELMSGRLRADGLAEPEG